MAADTNAVVARYGFETVEGTTPSVEAQTFRITNIGFNPEFTTVRSAEILNTLRQRRAVRVSRGGMLTVGAELSARTLDDMLALMLLNTWEEDEPDPGIDRLRDGILRPSMSFEVQFTDLTNVYLRLIGGRLRGFQITLQRDQITRVNLDFMGWDIIPSATSAFSGAAARTTTTPYNSIDHLAQIRENGAAINRLENVTLNMQRDLRAKREMGNASPFRIGVGGLTVTGSMRRHFETLDLFERARNFEDSSFDFRLQDAAGERLECICPLAQFGEAQPAEVPGGDQDVMGTYNFEVVEPDDQSRQVEFQRSVIT